MPKICARLRALKFKRMTIMIGYVTLGTNDLVKSTAFFDALFASIGVGRFIETDSFVA